MKKRPTGKTIGGRAFGTKKISKAEELRGVQDVIVDKFDRLARTRKDLELDKRLGKEIRAYLTKRRERKMPVDQKMLKQYIVQLKRKMLQEITFKK
ncbi:hypothetical protein [Flammeovirga kamogawensis]|uniref:30S ribosomal protein S21 n=1 Tax=Flammeovirga kamogawensis TaxID=373891 RepID=A0ABX8H196_9BACT|nr:hypothetical protein [Flammeovirga kamogawensis]MBB6462354.1 hypothetical protein [Flammeovirga kamogawensis]QWG09468.1 hypothetical protein KM029_22950 [Flammeovirga kamogawensis]TRX64984.1 hypothetical protein EO216_20850 [Flammeovirga kamogawensis]